MALCENLVKYNFTKKKGQGGLLLGAITLRAKAPARMSLRLLIAQDKDILTGASTLKVSAPAKMPPSPPIRS